MDSSRSSQTNKAGLFWRISSLMSTTIGGRAFVALWPAGGVLVFEWARDKSHASDNRSAFASGQPVSYENQLRDYRAQEARRIAGQSASSHPAPTSLSPLGKAAKLARQRKSDESDRRLQLSDSPNYHNILTFKCATPAGRRRRRRKIISLAGEFCLKLCETQ